MEFGNQYANSDMAYDLRQRYAKIVGDHLDDIAFFRKDRIYPEYFRALEDLHTIVQHKFKTKKEEDKEEEEDRSHSKKQNEKKDKKKETKSYSDLRTALIDLANRHTSAWKGESSDPEEIAKIEKALRDVEKFLLDKMDKANMFGSKRETEGLI